MMQTTSNHTQCVLVGCLSLGNVCATHTRAHYPTHRYRQQGREERGDAHVLSYNGQSWTLARWVDIDHAVCAYCTADDDGSSVPAEHGWMIYDGGCWCNQWHALATI